MPTIYKYFKEKTSSILKSVFILAWRQGLRVLHLESRQLLNTCQSTLWFIPWLFFFFSPLPHLLPHSFTFISCSFSSFFVNIGQTLTFLFPVSPDSSLAAVLGVVATGPSLCSKTSPRLSSWMELVKCVSNHVLSLGPEDNPGFGFGSGAQPRGNWQQRRQPALTSQGRPHPTWRLP